MKYETNHWAAAYFEMHLKKKKKKRRVGGWLGQMCDKANSVNANNYGVWVVGVLSVYCRVL